MNELIAEALRWYNLPWTVLLGIVALYWAVATIGLIDLDFLDFDFDFDADADLDADVSGHGGGLMGAFFDFLQIGNVPLMVILSGIIGIGWALSLLANYYMNPSAIAIVGAGIAIAASLPSLVISSILMRPLAMFYKRLEEDTDGNLTMIGRTCIVRTDRVDEHFGQAEVATSDGPLIINVRIGEDSTTLSNGDSALIIGQDKEHMLYRVRKVTSSEIVSI